MLLSAMALIRTIVHMIAQLRQLLKTLVAQIALVRVLFAARCDYAQIIYNILSIKVCSLRCSRAEGDFLGDVIVQMSC